MLRGFKGPVPGVFAPPANSLPTGLNKRQLIANAAPFRITATLPKGPMPTPVWQNDDLTALAEQPPDPVTGTVADQTMTILSDPTQKAAVRTKYRAPKNPLKAEDQLQEMRPTDNVLAGMKDRWYQAMIADVMSSEADVQQRQAKLSAITTARLQNLDQIVTGEVTDQFIQDFRDWLCKKGRKVDHLRAGWWPADPANPTQPQKEIPNIIASGGVLSDHPSVKHYVNRFIINRADFERDLVIMRLRAQSGAFLKWDINTLWKYYKYVVRGLVPDETIAEDPDVLLTTEQGSHLLQEESINNAMMAFAAPFLASIDNLSGQLSSYQQEVQRQNEMLSKLIEQQSGLMAAPPPPPPPAPAPAPAPVVVVMPPPAAPAPEPTVQPAADVAPSTVQQAVKPEPDEQEEDDPLMAAPPVAPARPVTPPAERQLPETPPETPAREEAPPPPVPDVSPAPPPPDTPPRQPAAAPPDAPLKPEAPSPAGDLGAQMHMLRDALATGGSKPREERLRNLFKAAELLQKEAAAEESRKQSADILTELDEWMDTVPPVTVHPRPATSEKLEALTGVTRGDPGSSVPGKGKEKA